MNTMSCKFDGFTAYGNEKLTLAGELYYGFKQSESIKEAHLVVGDTSTDIEVGAVGVEGTVPINVSEYVDASFEEEHAQIREVCLEFVTESGIIYQLYPYFSAGGCHVIHRGEESMDERYFINQNTWIVIKLPDGTVYEMNEY